MLPLQPPEQLKELFEDSLAEAKETPPILDEDVQNFVAFLAEGLSNAQIWESATWQTTLAPYLKFPHASALIESYRLKVEDALVEVDDNDSYGDDGDVAEDDIIVQVQFNLAYGGMYYKYEMYSSNFEQLYREDPFAQDKAQVAAWTTIRISGPKRSWVSRPSFVLYEHYQLTFIRKENDSNECYRQQEN